MLPHTWTTMSSEGHTILMQNMQQKNVEVVNTLET